ncbi:MAG: hypothetical protein EOQ55_23655 [Mesorhizobium sp.]|nr:MAG: hypothetical protein EOQ55_23655 [Mesorhizobium sp.]
MVQKGAGMTNIYLSRIELENFRTFGSFGLDVPAAPGLTLLVGTNGLGKSSFFDGLEWCLTGEIRRFSEHLTRAIKEKDYLTRRDAEENSHRVSLRFSRGENFTRSASLIPSAEAILGLLKTDKWGPIADLGTYLAFTHFLGQAAQQRFTSRDRGEQWESLKGPSGIDRLEEVRSALRGAPTRNAFRRRLDEQQRVVDDLASALTAWQDATARLARLRSAADAAGEYSGASLESRIRDVQDRVASIAGNGISTDGAAGEQIIALRQAISEETTRIQERQAELVPFDSLIQRHIALKVASDPEGSSRQNARQALVAATDALSRAETARSEIQGRLETEATRLREFETILEGLISSRNDIEQIASLEARLAAVGREHDAVSSAVSARRQDVVSADSLLSADRTRRADLAGLSAAVTTAQRLVDRASDLARLEREHQLKLDESASAAVAADGARANTERLRLEEAQVQAEILDGARLLEEARLRASEITSAVARIASHLSEHEEACPVCSTPFEPGILKRLAQNAASERDAVLAPLEAAQAGRTARAAEIARDLTAYADLVAAAEAAESAAAASKTQAEEARRALATSLGIDVVGDLAAAARQRHSDAVAALARLNATIESEASNVATAQANRDVAVAEIQRFTSELSALTQTRAEFEASLRRHRDDLAAAGRTSTSIDELDRGAEETNRSVALTRERRSEIESELAGALAIETTERQRVAESEAELKRADAAIDAAGRDLQAVEERWSRGGLPGRPDGAVLDEARETLVRKAAELATLLTDVGELAAANEAAARHQDLAELVTWMNEQGGEHGADDPSQHEGELQRRHKAAVDARQLTESTQSAVNAYTERLKKEAEDFSTQFLVPLNDLIDDYNRALLSTPGESIRFNAAHNVDRTKFDMGLRYRDQLDEALYNTTLPPQIVLSEGQMAANGFSILCAASTAYPWSNWRALLLDDPLQHNDIIHAAAFVDVMRNLVQLQGYQLIMSSHDRAEGEFFARKFDAANLPCTVVALTAPSKDGVKFDPPRYNTAARALINERIAQTG